MNGKNGSTQGRNRTLKQHKGDSLVDKSPISEKFDKGVFNKNGSFEGTLRNKKSLSVDGKIFSPM